VWRVGRTAERQSSRAAEQQSSRAAEQQSTACDGNQRMRELEADGMDWRASHRHGDTTGTTLGHSLAHTAGPPRGPAARLDWPAHLFSTF
jgi:hypothetical protein